MLNRIFTKLLSLAICLNLGCTVPFRYAVYNFADVKDYKKFPSRPLSPAAIPFSFVTAQKQVEPKLTPKGDEKEQTLTQYLASTHTLAFLIIRKDTIIYEQYFKGYGAASVVPSFSMAKSVTSALIGFAIQDGLIPSVNEKAIRYIPEWKGRGLDEVSILHLLQMTSGIRFNESYVNPFGHAAKYYYGKHLNRYVARMKPAYPPGQKFSYHSGNTQVLGLILTRVLKDKTVAQYLEEKLWHPLGMEFPASWSIDKKQGGMEKTFCCLNARARDFARFGRLYLKKGNWNGQQLLPESWITESTKVDKSNGSASYYQYQWWIQDDGLFLAEGILGQYIFVDPKTETILVRLGRKEDPISWNWLAPKLIRAIDTKLKTQSGS